MERDIERTQTDVRIDAQDAGRGPYLERPQNVTRVVGIDLSLTSTGIATVRIGPGDTTITTQTVGSAPLSTRTGATLAQREARLRGLADKLIGHVVGATLVVIEGPAYTGAYGQAHDRSGLWWQVVSHAHYLGCKVAEVPPSNLKQYATGKGNAPKDHVLIEVSRRFSGVAIVGNDAADALVLAAMGARHLGHPIDGVPATHVRAMDKVRWPE